MHVASGSMCDWAFKGAICDNTALANSTQINIMVVMRANKVDGCQEIEAFLRSCM